MTGFNSYELEQIALVAVRLSSMHLHARTVHKVPEHMAPPNYEGMTGQTSPTPLTEQAEESEAKKEK